MAFALFKRKAPYVPPPEPTCAPDEAPPPPPLHALPPAQRGPAFAKSLKRLLLPLEWLGDFALGSKLNPMDKSGTLAVGLMLIAVVTGVLLLFIYRVGAPFESMQQIQASPFFLLLRGLHRYASDLCMVALGLHILRMAAQGKAWGPRTLAWVSGVVLLLAVGVVGWTGFVLVWDTGAKELVLAGARLLDLLPLFPEPVSRAFSGAALVSSSFFFMNLFLHMSLPLLLVLGLWLHTSRLARSAWLPSKKASILMTLALAGLAFMRPAPLGQQADLLAKGGSWGLNIFYNFWVPIFAALPPLASLALAALAPAALASLPWWWRPPRLLQPRPSVNDPSRCEGCNQCVIDCPFEAVNLVPREGGGGSFSVAKVNPALCVSCGLCVGSCDRLSIAPPDKDAREMLAKVGRLKLERPAGGIVAFHCENNALGLNLLKRMEKLGLDTVPYGVECLGQLHPDVALSLLKHFSALVFVGCPPARCEMREGLGLLKARMLQGQAPARPGLMQPERIHVIELGSAEDDEAWKDLRAFLKKRGLLKETPAMPSSPPWARSLAAGVLGMLCLGALGWLSALPTGAASPEAWLRLAWRLPGQNLRDCRPYTPEEFEKLPRHMRKKELCVNHALSYHLSLQIDGKSALEMDVAPHGARADRPLAVDEDLALSPGKHRLQLSFLPLNDAKSQGLRIQSQLDGDFIPGKARLLTLGQAPYHFELLSQSR